MVRFLGLSKMILVPLSFKLEELPTNNTHISPLKGYIISTTNSTSTYDLIPSLDWKPI